MAIRNRLCDLLLTNAQTLQLFMMCNPDEIKSNKYNVKNDITSTIKYMKQIIDELEKDLEILG